MNQNLKVYFISEKDSPRYHRCLQRIKDIGLEPVHIPAIRPLTFGEETRGSMRSKYWGSPLTLGEVGCFLAHRSAWLQIAKVESGPVLIVEDDVGFLPDAAEIFLAVAKRYNSKRDFIRFYSDWVRSCYRKVSINNQTTIGIPFSPGNCSVAYMLGPEVAERLCVHSKTFHCPSDDFLGQSWVHGVREIHCSPFPCIHDDGKVSIIGYRPKFNLSLLAEFQRSFYKFKNSLLKRIALLKALMRPV
jgi:GR25 family glycosyltransferase involved in LPS biosynthesis